MRLRTILTGFAAAAFSLVLAAGPAEAVSDPLVNAAMDRGQIGETVSGYLEQTPGSALEADVKRRMDEINLKRRAFYTELAVQKGETVNNVALVTAEKLITELPEGQMFKDGSGTWRKK
jgi:uncharacterized protein YdbL (DUF1318 family)